MIISIHFDNPSSNKLILSILSCEENFGYYLKSGDIVDDRMIRDFARFGLNFENSVFTKPLFEKMRLTSNIEMLSVSGILERIDDKRELENISHSDLSPEIQHIARNFRNFINDMDFMNWSTKQGNLEILDQILSQKDVKLSNEESLIYFILGLCKNDTEESRPSQYEILFSHVKLEYCSSESVESLLRYILNTRKSYSEGDKALFDCLGKRCKLCSRIRVNQLHSSRYYTESDASEANTGQNQVAADS